MFEGKTLTAHAAFADKASNAKMHGAKGVILVNDIHAHDGNEDTLEKFAKGRAGSTSSASSLFRLKRRRRNPG